MKRARFFIFVALVVSAAVSPPTQATLELIGVANATGEQEDEADKRIAELQQIRDDWVNEFIKAGQARRNAKSPVELKQLRKELSTKEHSFIERCFALAMKQPDSWIGLAALKLVACGSPETNEGQQAADRLVQQAASANLDVLKRALTFPANASERPLRRLAPVILERVKKDPRHPQAARLLASVVCQISVAGEDGVQAPPEFAEAADLVIERYADSSGIRNFCEHLGFLSGSPIWAGSFEQHLRTILKKNQHREVRVAASFALASVVQGTDESRQIEAERLYEDFLKQFDGNEVYGYVHVEKMLRDSAQKALVEMRSRGLGKPVPEIVGVDLNGRDMRLSDYRGKVVLLSFWATWCSPCLKMVPHERELASRLEGKPFVIVGVNGDDDQQAAERAAVDHKMTWRSFRKKAGDDGRSIHEEWNAAFPSFYLVDHQGIIRKRWVGTQPQEELSRAVDKLLDGPRTEVFESFPALEEKIAAAAKKAKRSVVRISWANARLFEQSLTGVILTADGYVATYPIRPFQQTDDLPPGRELFVHLSDGRKVPGVMVGSAPDWGFGLIKITQEGEWPQAEAGDSADIAMGDVCITLGYAPDGLIPPAGAKIPQNQEASLRVGHVTMMAGRRWLGTDCRISVAGSRDAGAGLFDLQGRLVGIYAFGGAYPPLYTTAEAILTHWKDVAGRQRPDANQSQAPGDTAKAELPSPDDPNLAGVVAKARQVTVAIVPGRDTNEGAFSGTLVKSDGHIATCAHHDLPPGSEVTIHLSDGRSVPGTILGRDRLLDIGLAKITAPGPWPHVEFATSSSVKTGDICLALGYPGWERDGSPKNKTNQFKQASLEVGRVRDTRLTPGILEASQPMMPGASGGGLFDSQGRLIGLHTEGAFPVGSLNLRAGTDLVKEHWDFLLTGPAGDPRQFDEGPVAQAFRKVAGQAPPVCVEVLGEGKRQCLGTIVSEDGYILTKASELYGTISCRLADGRVLPATVGKASPEHDLALLKIQTSGLGKIRWNPNEQIAVGTFLGVTRFQEPPAVGVVSLAEHSVPRIPGWLVLGALKDAQGGVEVSELRGVWEIHMPIRKGDVIIQVEGHGTPNLKTLEEVAKRDNTGLVWELTSVVAGDPVRVTVRREGKTQELRFPLLSTKWDPFGVLSPRRCAFPAVFETDATISKDSCGGPVVDRSGEVLGITIAKAAEHRAYIIPAAIARKVFEQLKE